MIRIHIYMQIVCGWCMCEILFGWYVPVFYYMVGRRKRNMIYIRSNKRSCRTHTTYILWIRIPLSLLLHLHAKSANIQHLTISLKTFPLYRKTEKAQRRSRGLTKTQKNHNELEISHKTEAIFFAIAEQQKLTFFA